MHTEQHSLTKNCATLRAALCNLDLTIEIIVQYHVPVDNFFHTSKKRTASDLVNDRSACIWRASMHGPLQGNGAAE